MRKCLIALLLLVSAFHVQAQFQDRQVTASNGIKVDFYQFTPEDYSRNGKKHPVIIFLHGISERGNGPKDLKKVLKAGLPKFIKNGKTNMRFKHNGKWESFVVLIPQLSSRFGNWQSFYTEEMIKFASRNLNIDEDRIFLTGLSLGGGGVWSYASGSLDQAKKLAGIAPICGTCAMSNGNNIAKANLPVWAFHAKDDNRVSVSCSQNAVKNILSNTPAIKPVLTLWNNGKHNVWDRVYDPNSNWIQPSIYEWFLSQSKSPGSDKPENINKKPVADAGNDQQITLPTSSVVLDGGKSSDADGKIVAFSWSLVKGNSKIKIANPDASSTSVTNLAAGEYVFRLTVTDNDKASSSSDVKVFVEKKKNKSPVPVITGESDLQLPKNTVQLSGRESEDEDGKITSYLWTKISGPSSYQIASKNNVQTQIIKLVKGSYVFRLTVTDNDKAKAHKDFQITVHENSNKKPVADAGNDQNITLPASSVKLDGSKSSDPDGKIVSYAWTKVKGSSKFRFSDAKAASTTVSNLEAGEYVFRLTVTDNDKASSSSDVKVTVEKKTNKAPTAHITGEREIQLPNNNVELSGRESTDEDGTIKSYLWTKVSGPASFQILAKNNVQTQINKLVKGTYVFRLTITDNDKARDAVDFTVKVNEKVNENKAPVIRIEGNQEISLPVNRVDLSARESSDPDGKIVRYHWTKVSGPSSYNITGPNNVLTRINRLNAGNYVFRLTVWDNDNAKTFQDFQIRVNQLSIGIAPIAKITGPDNISLPQNSVELSGRESTTSSGEVQRYLWTKISGPASHSIPGKNNAKTLITRLVEGTYVFRLTIWDKSDRASFQNHTITVSGTSGKASVSGVIAKITGPSVITLPLNTVELSGRESSSPNGEIAQYRWSKLSGPSSYVLPGKNNAKTLVGNLKEGVYVFRLIVTDQKGASSQDDYRITVTAPKRNGSNVAGQGITEITGQKSIASPEGLRVFPNPVLNQLTIQFNENTTGTGVINIYDATGGVVKRVSISKNGYNWQDEINVSSLKAGMYNLELRIGNSTRKLVRFIKQ